MGFHDGLAAAGFAPRVVNTANPTSGWDRVPIYGTWRFYDGTPKAGNYSITCPKRVVNNTQDIIYPPGVVAAGPLDVDPTHKSLNVPAVAVDDPDTTPNDWALTVAVTFAGGGSETYSVAPSLSDLPTGVNLRTRTPV